MQAFNSATSSVNRIHNESSTAKFSDSQLNETNQSW